MRLYVLPMGLYLPPGSPVPAYLIQTDDGKNILVDSGLPRETIGVYKQPGYEGFAVDEEDFIVNRLAVIGLKPGDIDHVICTHLDPDHAGGHDNFPDAEFVVQRSHLDAARSGQYDRFEWMRAHWDAPGLRYSTVEGDTEFVPGVELIESSGHAVGHQSVLVRLPQTGPVLLAIDAIPQMLGDTAPEERVAGPFDMDEAQMRASTRKLVDLAAREGVALIIHGHDPAQWTTLRRSPQYYS